jgi:hypothetical protein
MKTTEFKQRTLITEQVTYILWESAGRKIIEAQLTPDQISKLFTNVEQGATAAGGNRTMVGKGKDAAGAVNKAWIELKSKVQDSAPVKNVDAMYDQAVEKLKKSTGGDEGVDKYVQKYRAFAKKHPMAQSFVYAALIAAAGISGAGAGGAAALGLFKLTDKLLQGEKFSSAAYSGAKTGALAYGAAKLADYVRGDTKVTTTQTTTSSSYGGGEAPTKADFSNKIAPGGQASAIDSAVSNISNPLEIGSSAAFDKDAILDIAAKAGDEFDIKDKVMNYLIDQPQYATVGNPGTFTDQINSLIDAGLKGKGPFSVLMKTAGESINFNPIQIETIIEWCDLTPAVMLTEGPMDAIKKGAAAAGGALKKGASAVGAKAKTVGKNMTTKVTADKLNKAWAKAGKPTDSDAIANILRQQGVSDQVLAPVYKQMGAKLPAAPKAVAPGAKPGASGKPAAPAAKTSAAPGGKPAAATMDFKGIQQAVAKLTPVDAKALVTHIDSLGSKPAAAPNTAAQSNAAPNAQPAAQGATAATTAPGQAPATKPATKPAAAPKNAAAGDTFEKAKGDIRKVQGGQKPMPPKTAATIASDLAKLAKGDKESGVAAAQKIMTFAKAGVDVSKQQQAWIGNAKAGERFLTQSVYFEISKMLKEHNLSWSDLGMRVHLLEGTNKMFGISLI